jgi:hypothetical protein
VLCVYRQVKVLKEATAAAKKCESACKKDPAYCLI